MDTDKDLENPDTIVNNVHNPVHVYCRLRPLKMPTETCCAQIKDLTTVFFSTHANELRMEENYVFKQVFDEFATQADVYNVVARPLVERLVRGYNSLLFTYGVTGSGKTYTMAGVENQCGILPRCLKTLFQTIASYQASKGIFQSDHLNGFEIATESDIKPLSYRETLRTARSVVLRRKNSEPDLNLESIGPTSAISGINEHNFYAVFVSYVEIYNNAVYDLLEEASSQKALQSHIVREDSNHNMYIHGATELQVNSVQEAIEAFQIGQKRKRTGQTALNDESSRSHSVFNVRLVQAPSEKPVTAEENLITISQLSLVDLAGSERSSRTKNTGARLRETGKINNSLMKLRECLKYLRENQQAMMNGSITKKIPYRDSKLTYLFKNFFEGDGQVSMIVCVNPNMNDYAENLKVLKFAEDTQKVQIVNTRPIALSTPFKRQAWNKEHTEQTEKNVDNESAESKMKPVLSIKKPIPCPQSVKTQKSQTYNLNRQLELNEKKIIYLENQNLELRLELNRLREAYKKLMGRPWCDDVTKRSLEILATARKPLLVRQKSNISENVEQLQASFKKQNTNTVRSFGSDFQNELKLRLQKQRKKLEASLVESKGKYQKRRCPFDNTENCAEENQFNNEEIDNKIETHSTKDDKEENMDVESEDTAGKDLTFAEYNSSCREIKSNELYRTPRPKKMKFDECAQMDVFASFRMITPKTPKHSTPYNCASSNAERQCNFFDENITIPNCKSLKNLEFQKDNDFDKREHELSLKMENHRKTQSGNKYLMDILCSIRRTKSSTNIFHKTSLSKRKLFLEKNEQRCFTDEES